MTDSIDDQTEIMNVLLDDFLDFFERRFTIPAIITLAPNEELSFRKGASGWELLVQYGGSDPRPLTNCSRLARIVALEHMEALYDKLLAMESQTLERLLDANRRSQALLQRLKAGSI